MLEALSWSELREERGARRLFVDGEPFLALGIQFDFVNAGRPEGYDYLFAHAERLGCNTVFFPVQWSVVEPRPGEYDWAIVDHTLARCRELGLRVAWLWFGTNQGGDLRPAPSWIKNEPARFRRLHDRHGAALDGLCPNGEETLRAERTAFERFLTHLDERDGFEHTSILLQIENEVCFRMSPEARGKDGAFDRYQECCFCEVCRSQREATGQSERDFGLRSLCRYLSELLLRHKELFAVPAYVNFPINPLRPGQDLDHYLEHVPELDFVAPDYYGFSPHDFAFAMRHFKRGRNALLVAEHSTESLGAADDNLYLAIAEHDAIGFDPWAIDHAFGWRAWRDKVSERPFVERDGSWSEMAQHFGRAQRALRAGMRQVARAVGSDELMFFVCGGVPRKIEERRWGMHFRLQASGERAKWMIVHLPSKAGFLILGVEAQVSVRALDGTALRVERGHYDGERWVSEEALPASGDEAHFELGEGPAFRVSRG